MMMKTLVVMIIPLMLQKPLAQSTNEDPVAAEDYCLTEVFHPQCLDDEVIQMKSATYGRMRFGRCITAEEIDGIGSRYLGCSADVLPLLNKKCSGKKECEIRVFELATENVKPCPLGLYVYLETIYTCIKIADERRSCSVYASTKPIHLVSSKICGTKSQPWNIYAPVGQKINISLLEVSASNSDGLKEQSTKACIDRGVIVDKPGQRNSSICVDGRKEKHLFLSAGNTVEIVFDPSQQNDQLEMARQLMLKVIAIGCSDIVPPEDAYLKRKDDLIMITCYTSRKSWHLKCVDGKWIGVIGNCSQGISEFDPIREPSMKAAIENNEQVLAIVALGGFTVAICLAVACFGIVCMRRIYAQRKKKEECKMFGRKFTQTNSQPVDQLVFLDNNVDDLRGQQQIPTYSVYVGESNFGDEANQMNSNQAN